MSKYLFTCLTLFIFSFSTLLGQKVYTYSVISSTYNLNVNGAFYKKIPMVSSTEQFGNIDNPGNLYSYTRSSVYGIQVYKNGTAFKVIKDNNFGNVSNLGNVYTYRIDTSKLKVSMNQTLYKTITLTSGEVYGETDDAGNVYTYTYFKTTLTIRKNGTAYRTYTNFGTFGSVDNSGNIYSFFKDSGGNIFTYRNGVLYLKTVPPLSTDIFADCR